MGVEMNDLGGPDKGGHIFINSSIWCIHGSFKRI